MAEQKTKKGGTREGPAKSKVGLVGAILLAIGLAWLLWSSLLRPPTKEEQKAEQDRIQAEKQDAARKKRQGG